MKKHRVKLSRADHMLFKPMRFILSAMAKIEGRYPGLSRLRVEGDTAVAADGKILHWVTHPLVKKFFIPGEYIIQRNNQEHLWLEKVAGLDEGGVLRYPKWRKVIPEVSPDIQYFTGDSYRPYRIGCELYRSVGIYVEYTRLQHLLLLDPTAVQVEWLGKQRAVLIKVLGTQGDILCRALIHHSNIEPFEVNDCKEIG